MKKKGGSMKSAGIEIPLPEEVIQHIQSFLSRKEAARSTILSKSWYAAWLTRPSIDIDEGYFRSCGGERWVVFEEFAKKTMIRYHEAGLKIERFRLCILYSDSPSSDIVHISILGAMKMGATDVELRLPWMATFPLSCVLGSQTLLSLSLNGGRLEGNYDVISCLRLKSLTLKDVRITSGDDDVLKDIISCCISLEDLSLSQCTGFTLSSTNLYELHKLRHLFLHKMKVDSMFFSGFTTRFPCLKDLSVVKCLGCTRVEVASNSLQAIRFEPIEKGSKRAMFDVPNIWKFTHSCSFLPNFSINGASREWELDISIWCDRFHKPSWFMNLKKLLTKFRLSWISLSIYLRCDDQSGGSELKVDQIEAVPKPLTVENLTIDAESSFCCALLVRLFGICRPNFITHYLAYDNTSIDILCERLMHKLITPNSGIPDQDMFGKFGLKQVYMEVYEIIDKEWRPLVLEKPLDAVITSICKWKVEFELIWD